MNTHSEDTINLWVRYLAENPNEPKLEKWAEEPWGKTDMEFEEYKKTWKKLNDMQQIEQFDTDKAWNKLFSRIDTDETLTGKPKAKTIKLNKVWAIAASVAILIGLAGFYMTNSLATVNYKNTSLTAQLVTLPDGSKVYLNTNSEVIYHKQFGKKMRELSLTGEAFFEVVKDKNKPFVVQTAKGFVKVLGTSFNVNAKSLWVEVVVKTGRVEVYNSPSNSNHVVLMPGDNAVLNGIDKIEKTTNTNANYLSWMDKKFVFKAQSLAQVVADLNTAYNCNIQLADSSIASLKITTTFDNDPIEDVLASIAIALNLKVLHETDTFKITANN